MTDEQRLVFERWIIEHVDEREVPDDEGHGEGLVYNLIHLLREGRGYRRFAYEPDQQAELADWFPGQDNEGDH